ncbi:MAG TPA: aminoglycoside phosphotransferase family protein [Polyangiales bacterium]|nr:aminoglycoside phosphotransferase family protein [Polyangiales bacterium]
MRARATAEEIGAAFEARFGGGVSEVRAHGSGHIHDSFQLRFQQQLLLVQRFNTAVFGDPQAVMHNIARVTDHLRSRLAGAPDLERRVLRVQPTPDGALYWQVDGATYRAFHFIEGTTAFDVAQRPEHPYQAGAAFGAFVRLLADLPAPPLLETIPGFHDTPARVRALREALARDPVGRAGRVTAELEQIERHAALAETCVRSDLPLRVTHNDTKLSNLLFDAVSGEAVCVVDLDTVMPGHIAYDFGDLVRTTACLVAEDARDPNAIEVRADYLEALARGFLAELGTLHAAERSTLAAGPRLICFELGVRFLSDYVSGDTYFAIARPEHNLERARVQLALVERLRDYDAVLARVLR